MQTFLKPEPRDYQVEATNAFILMPGVGGIVQPPTGCGKTLTTASIFDQFPGRRCLFLAHTDELVRQTCRAMLRMGLWPKVEKADEYRGTEYIPDARERRKLFGGSFPPNDWFTFGKVWVSSMQTFIGRVDKYAADGGFDLACIDEAHRSRCPTYEEIVRRLMASNPKMRLLGLTATPYRADKKNIGHLFPQFAYRMPILDAIDRGWLVDVRGVRVEMKADTSKWVVGSTSHGRDLTDRSLRASMASEECVESIAHPILERGEGRKGIVFLPGIEACEAVAAAINELKPGYATFVHGKVPKKERRRRVRAFEDGEIKVMTRCQVFVEGFDVPDVSLVVMARPTQSRGLYEQMLGRGLRVLADALAGKATADARRGAIRGSAKPDCLVMDFVNNTRFKLVDTRDVLLAADDNPRMREYVRKQFDGDEAEDARRTVREKMADAEALFHLHEALRTGGRPPPRQEYTVSDVNLFGAGGTAKVGTVAPAARPTSAQVREAHQFFIDAARAERMTARDLAAEIDRRKARMVGRSNFGFLLGRGVTKEQIRAYGLNYHDAAYLRRLAFARPDRLLPANWLELVERNRGAKP
ncbi:MAG: DEAD/DEAH box helicase [Gemmataceae bacterium]